MPLRLVGYWIELDMMLRRARREHALTPYSDLAMTPVTDDETESLEMFTHNAAVRGEVAHQRKVTALTHSPPSPVAAQHA